MTGYIYLLVGHFDQDLFNKVPGVSDLEELQLPLTSPVLQYRLFASNEALQITLSRLALRLIARSVSSRATGWRGMTSHLRASITIQEFRINHPRSGPKACLYSP